MPNKAKQKEEFFNYHAEGREGENEEKKPVNTKIKNLEGVGVKSLKVVDSGSDSRVTGRFGDT